MKISSHYACFKAIKNPPVLQVCRWSLGGHGGSWQYFSTCQSLLNDSRIIWWKFQVITPLPTCYLTIRNPPVLEVKNLESWRTGWILVSMLANQAMSPEYSLKIWSKLAHCGLSYDYFYKRGSINQPLLCNSPHSAYCRQKASQLFCIHWNKFCCMYSSSLQSNLTFRFNIF